VKNSDAPCFTPAHGLDLNSETSSMIVARMNEVSFFHCALPTLVTLAACVCGLQFSGLFGFMVQAPSGPPGQPDCARCAILEKKIRAQEMLINSMLEKMP
jgi:hypothetical protein